CAISCATSSRSRATSCDTCAHTSTRHRCDLRRRVRRAAETGPVDCQARRGVESASMGGLAPLDLAALAVLGIAALRGMFLGLVRESFSLASLGVAYAAVLLYTRPIAAWLEAFTHGRVGTLVAPWLAGGGIMILGIAGTVVLGRLGKRGARMA